ncbi:MAG: hypothetical protein ACO1TE_29095 [Prosthecobacter sp.]
MSDTSQKLTERTLVTSEPTHMNVITADGVRRSTWSVFIGHFAAAFAALAHAARHKSGGADAIKLSELAAPDDNTTLDATTSLHGLMPKLDKTKLDGIEALADVTDAGNVGAAIHGVVGKTTPVDADTLALIDSEASNALKKVTIANLKALITAALVDGAPGTLDTLNEIADALNNDASFAATITAALGGKAATSRSISAAGLATGGGDLSADRTITVPAASQAEAEAGSDNTKAMTPLRVAQAIAELAASDFASITGDPTDNTELAKLILGVNVKSHGAIGDARLVSAVTVSGNTITAASGTFSSGDNGKLAYLAMHSLNPSTARTVTYVDTDEITLSGASLTSYNGADLILYTQDDADDIIAACAAAKAGKTNVILPAGGYVVNKTCLVINHASLTNLPQVIGEGSGLTRFFIAPDFAYGDLGYGDGVLTDIFNAANLRLSGFAVYGSYTDPGVGYKALYVHSCYGRIDDVRITSFRGGAVAAMYVSSSQMKIDRVHVEGNAGYGILLDGSTVDMMGCYHGNGTNLPGLYIYLSTVVQVGGTQDEATGHNILIQGASSRYTLIGGRVEGLASAYAVQIDAGVARFIGSLLHPYNDHANSGSISIASGATAIANGCTIKGLGTRYAVLNAGTFHDGGGNVFEGTGISSSGTIQSAFQGMVSMPGLPSSDPGVPGQLYHSSGVVMVSI